MKIKKVNIEDYKVFKDFEISFLDSKNEPLELIVLAGINGSGKTSLFEYILKTFDYEYTELKGSIGLNLSDEDILFDNIILENHSSNNLTMLFGENALKLGSDFFDKIKYLEAKKTNKDIKEEILKYIDFLIYEKELSAKDAYEKINQEISLIFKGLNIQVEFSNIDKDKNIFFKNSLGDKISIDELSTGEKELLSKVFYLFISDIKDSVVLIDEPEISLHPSWQNRIVKIYKNFAKQNNNQIIIATHSPQIIASAPNESLRVLLKENNTIKSYSPDAYGMKVNKALTDIMGVGELRDIEVQEKYDIVKNMILDDLYDSPDFKEKFDELEILMSNDSLDFGFLKLEFLKRIKNASNK